jgi:hypothetical protein
VRVGRGDGVRRVRRAEQGLDIVGLAGRCRERLIWKRSRAPGRGEAVRLGDRGGEVERGAGPVAGDGLVAPAVVEEDATADAVE